MRLLEQNSAAFKWYNKKVTLSDRFAYTRQCHAYACALTTICRSRFYVKYFFSRLKELCVAQRFGTAFFTFISSSQIVCTLPRSSFSQFTVRPAVHTNPSRKRSFTKTLFVFVWTENFF